MTEEPEIKQVQLDNTRKTALMLKKIEDAHIACGVDSERVEDLAGVLTLMSQTMRFDQSEFIAACCCAAKDQLESLADNAESVKSGTVKH